MLENFLHASEHLVGFLIVVMALCLLWGATALLGKVFAASEPAAAESPPAPQATFAAPQEEDEDLVVIAAAAAAILGGRHRVVSIRPQISSWGAQGRRDIHASHNIRKG
jgi:Na+-transporting methylmalonyl-CoA/oxaloacetate decarboxylase gamma subunit